MHPILFLQIAEERMAELRRVADQRRLLHELRAARKAAAQDADTAHHRWALVRSLLRRLRHAVAAA